MKGGKAKEEINKIEVMDSFKESKRMTDLYNNIPHPCPNRPLSPQEPRIY